MTKKKKKRRLRKSLRLPLFIICAAVIGLIVFGISKLFVPSVKSIHDDAKKISTKSCVAFYPKSEYGKQVAVSLCESVKESEEKTVFDYSLIPYGDYYLVEYGQGVHYYIDKNNDLLKIDSLDDGARGIMSDYLRYSMKKSEIDEAYTAEFILKTSKDKIDLSECSYKVEGSDLEVYFPSYDHTVSVPLKYIQNYAGVNLGYENESYVKPSYISKSRKMVALTFDDGPNLDTSPEIVDTFYKYDGKATFFIQGYRLDNKTVPFIKEAIEKGMQYGSHSQNHKNLKNISDKEVVEQIKQPADDLYYGYDDSVYGFEGLGYTMTVYRAPYGEHNAHVDELSPFINIAWDCDSRDWATRDKTSIKDAIYTFEAKNKDELDGCIVLMHDVYSETADAVKELVPELIDKGYQLVSIDELLNTLGIDKNTTDYYPW